MKRKRPFSVTLLALAVLTFAGFHLVRLVQALSKWDFLTEWLPFSPAYLALTGLVWILILVPLSAGLWFGWRWAPRLMGLAASAYIAYFWLDRLIRTGYLSTNAGSFQLFPVRFWIVLTVGVGLILAWIFTRPATKQFFGEQHEQTHQTGAAFAPLDDQD